MSSIIKFWSSIVLFTIICLADTNNDYTVGMNALNRGDIKTAKEKLSLAYKTNPSDPAIKLAFASIAPCSTAFAICKSIIMLKTVPDSLRGNAYGMLGDYSYSAKEYKIAADNYRNASKFGKKPLFRHFWALATFAAGDIESAKSIWHTLTLEYGDSLSEIAQYHLGLLNAKQKKFQDALVCFSKTGIPSQNRPWAIAALAEEVECAKALGLHEKAAQFETQLQPYKDQLLEEDFTQSAQKSPITNNVINRTDTDSMKRKFDTAAILIKKDDNEPDSVLEKPDSLKTFALQIGAFSAKENALSLVQKVRPQFPSASVVQMTVSGKVFYRVWIGSFKSKSEAEKFASDSLFKSGLSYRVIEK